MAEKPNQKKRRKWSLTDTVTRVSEPDGLDAVEFGEDLTISGLAVEVYGQKFTDPAEAERFKQRKIREARGEVNKKLSTPNTPLTEISESDSGVLDMQIARAEYYLPLIKKEMKSIEAQLQKNDLEPFQRGRLERDRDNLQSRKDKHMTNVNACKDRLNQIFESVEEAEIEDNTEGESPEA